MTEFEWLLSDRLDRMLYSLHGKIPATLQHRKARLFTCSCVRHALGIRRQSSFRSPRRPYEERHMPSGEEASVKCSCVQISRRLPDPAVGWLRRVPDV